MNSRRRYADLTDTAARVTNAGVRAGNAKHLAFRHLENSLDFASKLADQASRMREERMRLATLGEARHTLERVTAALPGFRLDADQASRIQKRIDLLTSRMQTCFNP